MKTENTGILPKNAPTGILNLPNFMPICFTMVMGTGAFAVATREMADIMPQLYKFAWFLNILNFIVFFILVGWFILTWKRSLEDMPGNFAAPATCSLYSTFGISLLVLGAQALRFDMGEIPAICFWSCGAFFTILLNFAIMLRFFMHPGLGIDSISPVFFIPVAGLVVVPVAGAQICAMLNPAAADIGIMLCALSLGGGIVLYLGLFCLMLQRHLLAAPLPAHLSPTFWIHIAPIGWGGVSLIRFAQYAPGPDITSAAQFCSLFLFGGALWWLVMAGLICLASLAKHSLTFSLAWWSFVFPTGSLAILSRSLQFPAAASMFPYIWALLAILWLLCALKTLLRGIGKIRQRSKMEHK